MVPDQMSESYGKRSLQNWHLSKPALQKNEKGEVWDKGSVRGALVKV
jgi:hypothetical protein